MRYSLAFLPCARSSHTLTQTFTSFTEARSRNILSHRHAAERLHGSIHESIDVRHRVEIGSRCADRRPILLPHVLVDLLEVDLRLMHPVVALCALLNVILAQAALADIA